MKKVMFFAMATAALFASCSSDESFTEGAQNAPEVEEGYLEGHELIKIGLGNVANITTKGTGTVGGVMTGDDLDANHSWAGQRFNLYMFEKGTTNLAKSDLDLTATPAEIYNNAVFEATGEATKGTAISGAATTLTAAREIADDGTGVEIHPYKYYPNTGNYDFWAYRVDDADTTNLTVADKVTVDFTINGTQDFLAAKATPVSADGADYTENANYAANEAAIFSATSARHAIYPELTFKHLLTRLTFKVLAGDANAAVNVKVDSIKVISNNKGTLTIADPAADMTAADAYNNLIEWTDDTDSLTLMARTGTASDNLTALPTGNTIAVINRSDVAGSWNDAAQLGEAIMVKPGEATYKVKIFTTEDLYLSEEDETAGTKTTVPSAIEGEITLPVDGEGNPVNFEQGSSYNVRIVAYGHEKIEIFTTLEQWKDGGSTTIDADEDANWAE